MNPFTQQLKNLGPARLAAMAGVAVGLIAFIIFFATRFSAQPMELLYGNLSMTDSREITRQLELSGIKFQVEEDGAEIMVPADQVTQVRLQMAEQALPTGGSVGYELFDNMDALGATNFMQNVNLVRALEGELARTIRSIEGVQSARVHLVMPQREMFTREVQDPSASVYIKMSAGRLAPNQVNAVQHMIASAIPKLMPSNISIVDERGTLLSRTFGNDDEMVAVQQDEARIKLENRLSSAIVAMVESSLGPGKVRAEVRAEMDFDRVVTEEEIYDPDGQVPRSTVTVDENLETLDSDPDNVTVGQNLPDAQFQNQGGPRSSTSEQRTEETVNFEISKRVVNQIRESGVVRRLSVAVLVDGNYVEDENGERVYQALPTETMDKLESLVRSAIGADAARGDQIEVINMPFTSFDDLAGDIEPFDLFGFSKEEVMRMAEGLGVAIVAVLVILLVVRPLVTKAFESMPAEDALLSADGGLAQLTGPGGMPMPMPTEDEDEDLDELIDIDKVEGRVKASSLRKINDIVDKHPEEAISIFRTWLYQEA
ncbi:MAG: flagellar basal-body MS-ring/collar protein FliF [Rhodospirillaceae bacterium]